MSNLTNNTSGLQDILAAVNALPEAGGSGGIVPEPNIQSLTVEENGTYKASDEGLDGYSVVTVNVPDTPAVVEELNVTENGTYEPSEGVDGFSKVVVDVAASGDVENQLHAFLDGTLTEIDSPVTKVRLYVCYGITTLKTVSLPNATSFGTNAFYGCTALASVDAPEATSIGTGAFNGCKALTSIDLPKATTISSGAFQGCTAVTSINLPNATAIGSSAFQGDSRFGSLNLPKVKTIAGSAFQDCRGLKRLNIPMCTSIAGAAFYICQNLDTVIISQSAQVCTLGGTNAFSSTKISAGTGYVYVPAALVDAYKAATNWSTYAAQIRAIEDYPEITGG